jgi:hypothetical protein
MPGNRFRFDQVVVGVIGLALACAPSPAFAAREIPAALALLFGLCLGLPALLAGLAVGRYAGFKRNIIVLLALVPFGLVGTLLLGGLHGAPDLALGVAILLLMVGPFAVFGWWLGRRARDRDAENRRLA